MTLAAFLLAAALGRGRRRRGRLLGGALRAEAVDRLAELGAEPLQRGRRLGAGARRLLLLVEDGQQRADGAHLGAPDARLLYNLGSLHMRLSQSEEAAAMFSEAIAAEPTHVKAMGNLASLRNAAGRFAEGIALLETALGLEGRQGRLPADLAVALGVWH